MRIARFIGSPRRIDIEFNSGFVDIFPAIDCTDAGPATLELLRILSNQKKVRITIEEVED